ncbi:MAG: outer membrane lipoprotein LolB [Candidatus Accumulibacter sp.]|uniref:lipoprotein insertase outer membrane protein LolB n=1 Tax=Accumulibacter sp. TaxID=2053492 RepID=UPI00258820E7|nr:lipoprotein insertase outer membrane protein LolB [Accumulibacter sp.]MBK8115819.1 outer membrane lipoprotein LolB [Accumulibacter sp.]
MGTCLYLLSGGRSLARLLGALGLSACTALPPPAGGALPMTRAGLHDFALSGRFALRQDGQSHVGRLNWRHDDSRNELLLSSPLGQGMAEMVSDASGARLIAGDGRTYAAANADELLQSVLGYPLPLSRLVDWLRGNNPGGGRMTLDGHGRPLRLLDEAWRIDYEYDSDDPQALPGRLFVEREGGFELRLRIDEWSTLSPAN